MNTVEPVQAQERSVHAMATGFLHTVLFLLADASPQESAMSASLQTKASKGSGSLCQLIEGPLVVYTHMRLYDILYSTCHATDPTVITNNCDSRVRRRRAQSG